MLQSPDAPSVSVPDDEMASLSDAEKKRQGAPPLIQSTIHVLVSSCAKHVEFGMFVFHTALQQEGLKQGISNICSLHLTKTWLYWPQNLRMPLVDPCLKVVAAHDQALLQAAFFQHCRIFCVS